MPHTSEIIGINHIYLAVSDLPRFERYYDAVMAAHGSDPDGIRLEITKYRSERRRRHDRRDET